ncbi:putative nucleic acid-binding, replication factor A [Helianthus annuus]|nr:putative nucleic acid-binding, replication factor A [Helianthus annuus]
MSLDTKGKSKVLCGDETVSPKGKIKLDMDLDNIAYRTRSNIHNKNECVDIDMMKPAENISIHHCVVRPKRKVKRSKTNSFLEFTKVAESKLRLPVDVSCDLCLSVDNLRDVSIKNLRRELIDMKTRAEKSGDGYSQVWLDGYVGKWGISNNFDGSRLFINDNFDEMLSSRKSEFLSKLAASTESSSHAGSYMMCSVEDEFLNNDVFSPIAYLGSIIELKKVVVVGTIVAIVSNKMWYYDGCNYCKSKVEQKFETYDKDDGTSDVRDEKLYQCSYKDCNGTEVFPLSRFKIPIRVQDSTGTVTLTLFDHEALKFVG